MKRRICIIDSIFRGVPKSLVTLKWRRIEIDFHITYIFFKKRKSFKKLINKIIVSIVGYKGVSANLAFIDYDLPKIGIL